MSHGHASWDPHPCVGHELIFQKVDHVVDRLEFLVKPPNPRQLDGLDVPPLQRPPPILIALLYRRLLVDAARQPVRAKEPRQARDVLVQLVLPIRACFLHSCYLTRPVAGLELVVGRASAVQRAHAHRPGEREEPEQDKNLFLLVEGYTSQNPKRPLRNVHGGLLHFLEVGRAHHRSCRGDGPVVNAGRGHRCHRPPDRADHRLLCGRVTSDLRWPPSLCWRWLLWPTASEPVLQDEERKTESYHSEISGKCCRKSRIYGDADICKATRDGGGGEDEKSDRECSGNEVPRRSGSGFSEAGLEREVFHRAALGLPGPLADDGRDDEWARRPLTRRNENVTFEGKQRCGQCARLPCSRWGEWPASAARPPPQRGASPRRPPRETRLSRSR